MEPSTPSKSATTHSRVVVLLGLSLVLIIGSLFLTNWKDTDTIIVTFPSGTEIDAEVADTPEKLLFGLAFREGLPPDSGML